MSASLRYGAAAVGVVALLTLVLWPFLEPAGRKGVLIAAAVALPVQVSAFSVLVHYRGRTNGFMAAWAGGMAIRAVAVAAVAFIVIRSQAEGAIPMLLALAGFFFALLLIEPLYFRADSTETA
ncbi:MAG: hypothetical protein OEO79_01970 [Gemmatimonadota bacterium]|nr:hypothetical protein [Gemmatimonadota bacterium]MDH3424045.1 hypothetical protein [Gemmatimonadota bacterium]